MAGYFSDYQPPKPVDFLGPMTGGISAAMDAIMQRRIEAQKHAEEMAFRNKQLEADNTHWDKQFRANEDRIAMEDRRATAAAKAKAEQDAETAARGTMPGVFKAIGEHNPDEASAMARLNGIGAERVVPEFKQLPQQQQDDALAEDLRNQQDENGAWAGAPVLPQEEINRRAEADQQARTTRAAMLDPTLRFTMPSGATADYRVNASREAKDRITEDELRRLIPNIDPLHLAYPRVPQPRMENVGRALVGSGATAADATKAMIGAADKVESAAEAEKRAKITASQKNSGEKPADARGSINSLDVSIKNWQQDAGYDKMAEEYRLLKVGVRQLKSNDPIEQTAARYAIGKAIAGVGSFTEGEQRTILGNVGGRFESFAQLLQNFKDGTLTSDQQKHFLDSVQGRLSEIESRRAPEAAKNFLDSFLEPGSGYEDMPANVQNRYNRLFKPFGIAPIGVSGRSVHVGGGSKTIPSQGPTRDTGKREALKAYLRSNPALLDALTKKAAQ